MVCNGVFNVTIKVTKQLKKYQINKVFACSHVHMFSLKLNNTKYGQKKSFFIY